MEATIPYVERDSNGEIVCLYGAVAPMFAQARTYLSTGKLQERLAEYPDVLAEAERLGVGIEEAVGHADDIHDPDRRWTICGRWPEWIDDAELTTQDPAPSGVFDSQPSLEEIREAYEASHSDESGAGDVGGVELSDPDLGGDAGELEEAGADALASDGGDDSPDPLGDDSVAGGAGAYPGVMVDHQHTETILMDLRAPPLQLVRAYHESRLTAEIGDENARQALHLAGNEDEFRDEKIAWLAAMETTLHEKLQAIQDETDPIALVNYRSEAEGWPPVPVEEIEYEDDEPEDE